jgi:hypothetical protein
MSERTALCPVQYHAEKQHAIPLTERNVCSKERSYEVEKEREKEGDRHKGSKIEKRRKIQKECIFLLLRMCTW